ncbi:MAG: glycosyltransferase family 2 protein [Prosthecobacter sp.]
MTWLVLIPSYNTGPDLLVRTVTEVLEQSAHVWVVIDGSTDGSAEALKELGSRHAGLRCLVLPENRGKGSAILHGVKAAAQAGFTHVLTMDADGQHPAAAIPSYVELAEKQSGTVLMGRPNFGPEAPAVRVQGRKISNALVWLETVGWSAVDCLFGMRMYPCAALLRAFESTSFARRFDFDAEICVRLAWMQTPMRNVLTDVRYLSSAEGGVSQFRYGRDNLLFVWMHTRLLLGALVRLPWLLVHRLFSSPCR